MTNQNDKEKEIVIRLKAWQIPYLLGSLKLGIWLEDWSASLIQSSIGTYDSHSARWIAKVVYIAQQIKEQTGIQEECKEYAESQEIIALIDKWVAEECKWNDEAIKEYQGGDL